MLAFGARPLAIDALPTDRAIAEIQVAFGHQQAPAFLEGHRTPFSSRETSFVKRERIDKIRVTRYEMWSTRYAPHSHSSLPSTP
jgi:hypothetical protein